MECIFPNKKEPVLARCDSIGVLGTATGITGLIVAQKTINFFLEKKLDNIMTMVNVKTLKIDNVKIKKNVKCQYLKKTIIYWTNILELETIINEHTLEKNFESPSGGEEKRIIILQLLFPILTGNRNNIKVIFMDYDGTLSNGNVYINKNGEELKTSNTNMNY